MFSFLSLSARFPREAGDSPTASAETVPAEAAPEPGSADGAELKSTLLKAVEGRKRRAENSVLRSMAEQNGVPEAELARMLDNARAEELPPEAQKKLAAANETVVRRLLTAEVKSVGAEMGLLDTEVALQLIPGDALSVGEDGAVTGVREALEALKQRKGYLFHPAGRGAWAQKVSSGGAPQLSGVEEAFYRKNPALRR